MNSPFAIKVYKQYFNFACSHFLIFKDGTREPLHGHNYRVAVAGKAPQLTADMVFDFLEIKPLVRKICDSLDHKLLLPEQNPLLRLEKDEKSIRLYLPDEGFFMLVPKKDTLILPIPNTSAERLAEYIGARLVADVKSHYQFEFQELEVEVEETPGQSAVFTFSRL